ncbi:hypothetical protein BH09VER1_BH09VER1_41650 [soil metagenome]
MLLAGGASSRMGRDKALLPVGDGRVLWQRQLEVLERLDPGCLFISGPARAGFAPELRILRDSSPGLGPLSGLVEGLRVTEADLLVVLAVDLPAMTSDYLASLLENCLPGRGCVARLGPWFEPLAAVYPKKALPLAEEALASEDRSLQTLARRLLDRKMISVKEVDQPSEDLFLNWNSGVLPTPGPENGWKDFPMC